jgi:hypothetical protein
MYASVEPPSSGKASRRNGQVQIQSRRNALRLFHSDERFALWLRRGELLADRARAVSVAARVVPQADRQRQVAAFLLLKLLAESVVTHPDRGLQHKQ